MKEAEARAGRDSCATYCLSF